ncbi:MAG: S9 family peptidase, partial [Anaerolineales bacterium]|nr:S9 family peptidase [Anaerolineales bacterium]
MSEQKPAAPIAAIRPQELIKHGHRRVDNYFWLRDKENPEVIEYIKAENAFTEAEMAHTKALQEQLYKEMVGRIQETDSSVPYQLGGYFYYTRTEEGEQYGIYCRKKGSLEAPEQIILNPNELARAYDFFQVGVFAISPDHNLLAYSADTTGGEVYTVFFKDLRTGQLLPDQLENTLYELEWANDNKTIFYTRPDDAWRSYRLFRHILGSDPATDPILFQEDDALFGVGLDKSKDDAYLFLEVASIETHEVYLLPADQPQGDFQLVAARERGIRYGVDHHKGTLYIVTNEGAKNSKVMTTPANSYAKENWQEFIPHRQNIKLDGIELFANHMALYQRENGLRTLRIIDLKTCGAHDVSFPEPVYTFNGEYNPEFNSNVIRFGYTSMVTPQSVYDYDMDTQKRELKKRQPVLGGYDPDKYATERIFATAADGVKIPISLVYKKGFQQDGSHPCLLYGYGSYGFNIDPAFNSNRLSLLDRGFVFAIAHIRGSQTMGRDWYENGKFLHKKNTFTDFIACGRHLVAEKYANPEKLAAMGGSAGGLLMGAVTNMAPDLWTTVVAQVPFVDVISTMLDESIPLTVGEYDEWGNPHDETFYHYMLSYSPYDQSDGKDYPNLL